MMKLRPGSTLMKLVDDFGQPWRNGYIESFNSRVRDECLNINMFWSLVQGRW